MGEAALQLVTPDEVMKEVMSIDDQAKALKVVDSPSYIAAGELWKAIKGIRAKVAEAFDANIKKAHELHKSLVAEKKRHDAPLDEAERMVKQSMSQYDLEQERKRREEQARLEAIARKEEEDRRLMEAIAAEEEMNRIGMTKDEVAQETAAILETPVSVAPIVIPKATPKLAGGPVYQTRWDYEIVAPNLIPREYLIPDTVKIGAVVRALKEQANIPGIKVFSRRV